MRVLRCEITIGSYIFDFITNFEIVSTWDALTDTCILELPKKLRYRGKDGKVKTSLISGDSPIFQKGDPITIKAGYYPNAEFGELSVFDTLFTGYLTTITPRTPITIEAEDAGYQLKRMRVDSYSSGPEAVDLREILLDVAEVVNNNGRGPYFRDVIKDVICENINIGETVIENASYAEWLDSLKKTYGLKSYIRENILYVGFARITQNNGANVFGIPNNSVKIRYGRDIIDDSNLTYHNAADVDINLTCISIDKDNNRLEAQAGESWGSSRNLYYTDKTEAELQRIAEAMVGEFKFTGYEGSFTIFGIPKVAHGDSVIIEGGDIEDTWGEYIIEKVTTSFGTRGYRQDIEVSAKINNVRAQ